MVNRSDGYTVIYILPHSFESVYDPGGDVLYYEPKSTLRLDGRMGELIFEVTSAKCTSTVAALWYVHTAREWERDR